MANPFTITVFDKRFEIQGQIRATRSATFDPKWNAIGFGSFELSNSARIRPLLEAEGTRVRVEYAGEHLMSGPVRRIDGDFTSYGGVPYVIQDDFRIVHNTLAWPVPVATAYSSGELSPVSLTDDAQSYSTAADVHTAGTAVGVGNYVPPADLSSAEAIIKDLLSVNFSRIGRPWRDVIIPPSLDRGGNVRAAGLISDNIRMEPLDEILAEILETSGLGLRVWHDGVTPRLQADVFDPGEWTQPLTHESGAVKKGGWSVEAPTGTRMVIGGPGEGPARAFFGYVDAELEELWGDVIEVFRDATGAQLKWPEGLAEELQVAKYFLLRDDVPAADKALFQTYIDEAARKTFTDNAPKVGLNIELAETPAFHFAGTTGFHLGDKVTIRGGGRTFTERITGCTVAYSKKGVTVTPHVGTRPRSESARLAQAIRGLIVASRRRATER